MKHWRQAILQGVMVWVIAFLAAFLIFPLRESSRPLFESIMPVVLAGAAAFFANRYLSGVQEDLRREGLRLGVLWMAINIAIDLPIMLSPSPMQMSPGQYVADIAVTYLLLPVVTGAMGSAAARAQASR